MSGLSELTYPVLLLAVLGQQLCLPIPSGVFLMAGGALAARGEMRPSILICLALSACLTADSIWFWFGRRWGSQAIRLVCRLSADPRKSFRNAHDRFNRYGLGLVCVARFFPGMGTVLPPLAAAEGASLPRFLAADALGSSLWSGFYVGVGFLFSNKLEIAVRCAGHFAAALGIAIVVPVVLYAGWRGLVLARMIRRLRLRRIRPPMLERKLKSNRKVAVLDLRNFEEEIDGQGQGAVPGAFRVDPSLLRKWPRIAVPDDIEIILYSSLGGDVVSARAAAALKRIGAENVWVLEGGLKAWREQGSPVSQFPVMREQFEERVGGNLPTVRLST